ncbi:tegument protein UL21 [Canid alphaherpesvirus 1]|uniref:Tegument protein UL21 n=3 Tax=Canid alphaherpesvirus 1 TaxID=170325 RepID=A0A172DSR5_9ALPH|nr:tegument protein UL21 [Canid alphaherpesvirus 1]ALL25914.1 tegument protein UL21 [Canid alphaherpesvirus 1]ALL26070.1 tegument protein UL21 [Canid alphaherpesvirus 1]ARE29843.1 tegument protein UL21 [Canid alphaherpesvirus 1]QQL08512.1 tegument protein UL21 [Canid alphaherpesvirus 1]QQL08587.1 tegument protein UL21 [Canid alphaherpesvirus 1]
MDFKYNDTIVYKGVVFYIYDNGNRAYFTNGGCILSVPRPKNGKDLEIAKFGLTIRGLTSSDRVVANYVKSELNNTGRGWAIPQGEDVFLDSLDLLTHGPGTTERDLCGNLELEIYDTYLTECMVSLKVSSGIIITTGRDLPQERILRLFYEPIITNATSGFVYKPSSTCFALVQAYLTELPESLKSLLFGLFDEIPIQKLSINDNEENSTNVIVTSNKAISTIAIRPARYAMRALRRETIISNFVQVRYIPKPCSIWDPQIKASNLNSIQILSLIFNYIDYVIKSENWNGLDEELNEARFTISVATASIFGENENIYQFIGSNLISNEISKLQLFVLIQFIFARCNLFNCYATLEKLTNSYIQVNQHPIQKLNVNIILDSANEIIRKSSILGNMSILILHLNLPGMIGYKKFTTNIESDSEILTSFVMELENKNRQFMSMEKIDRISFEISKILECLYTGKDIWDCGVALSRSTKNSIPFHIALENKYVSAFDTNISVMRGAYFLHKLVSKRFQKERINMSIK